MKIDSWVDIALTRFKGKVVLTDHRMLKLQVDLFFHNMRELRTLMLEIRNVRKSKKKNSHQEGFFSSKCFISDNMNIDNQFDKWQQRFHKTKNTCFKKCRSKTNKKKGIIH